MLKKQFDYIAHGPAHGPARKLVVLLHGYGVDARYMEKMAGEVQKQIPDALIISPHAPHRMNLPPADKHDGLAVPPPEEAKTPPAGLTPERQREWFEITPSAAKMNKDLLAMAKKINDFIDSKRDELGLRDQDIAVMGFSQGGAVALYAACTRTRQIACAAGHSTLVVDTQDFTTKPPVLLVYGTADKNFSLKDYKLRAILPLKGYLPDFSAKEIKGLGHTTSRESRKAVAGYIARKFNP